MPIACNVTDFIDVGELPPMPTVGAMLPRLVASCDGVKVVVATANRVLTNAAGGESIALPVGARGAEVGGEELPGAGENRVEPGNAAERLGEAADVRGQGIQAVTVSLPGCLRRLETPVKVVAVLPV